MNALPDFPENLATADKLASTLGVSKSFIYKAVERNEIPHLRLGSLIRFDLNEVRAWLLSKRVRPSAPAASAAT